MQIFTRSPRIWKTRPVKASEIEKFRGLRKSLDIRPLVVHAPYLPNLASSDSDLYKKSKDALLEDMMLSEKLGADYFVIHPGSYSLNSSLKIGVEKIASAIDDVYGQIKTSVMILIENVSGGGRKVASNFDEIKMIMEQSRFSEKLGICLDTAHLYASGFDISGRSGLDEIFEEIDRLFGMDKLKAFHLNNTVVKCGSRVDRHSHISPELFEKVRKGVIGEDAWMYLINSKAFKNHPGILETPKDADADKVNLRYLKSLQKSQ